MVSDAVAKRLSLLEGLSKDQRKCLKKAEGKAESKVEALNWIDGRLGTKLLDWANTQLQAAGLELIGEDCACCERVFSSSSPHQLAHQPQAGRKRTTSTPMAPPHPKQPKLADRRPAGGSADSAIRAMSTSAQLLAQQNSMLAQQNSMLVQQAIEAYKEATKMAISRQPPATAPIVPPAAPEPEAVPPAAQPAGAQPAAAAPIVPPAAQPAAAAPIVPPAAPEPEAVPPAAQPVGAQSAGAWRAPIVAPVAPERKVVPPALAAAPIQEQQPEGGIVGAALEGNQEQDSSGGAVHTPPPSAGRGRGGHTQAPAGMPQQMQQQGNGPQPLQMQQWQAQPQAPAAAPAASSWVGARAIWEQQPGAYTRAERRLQEVLRSGSYVNDRMALASSEECGLVQAGHFKFSDKQLLSLPNGLPRTECGKTALRDAARKAAVLGKMIAAEFGLSYRDVLQRAAE